MNQLETKEKKKRHYYFEIILFFVIIGISVLALFAKHYPYFPFDLYITREIQEINWPFFSSFMIFVSWFGNFYQTLFSILGCAIIFFYFKKKDLGIGVLISAFGAVLISEVLKIIISRPRPDPTLIHQIEKFSRDDSFPSGHVLFYMGFYGFLLFLAYTQIKHVLWRRIITAVLFVWLILVGVSRIDLGSHWFSDTLASYLIGSVWLYIMILIFKKFRARFINNAQ